MKHLLNTLYVTTAGAYLAREGETIKVRVERETRLRLPIHTLGGIICFGRVSCSPAAMDLCGSRGVGLVFLSDRGRFLARVTGRTSGNVLLRRAQYRAADDALASAAIARHIVLGKIANGRTVLQRALRDRPEDPGASAVTGAVQRLGHLVGVLREPLALDVVRGHEGEAAREYFAVFDHLITSQKSDFFFRARSRRPPLDRVNALLSFLYTLLTQDVASAAEAVGLDPAVGFLHRDRPGRPGLALDLMEELRPVIVDRLVLSLVNRQQVRPRGFVISSSGAVTMDDVTRKEVIVAYQKRKQEEVLHPFLGEKVPIGLIPHLQALLFARYLRGDLDGYPPFVWR